MRIVPGPWAACLFANILKVGQWLQNISPPQTVKGVLNFKNRVGIFAGDGVDASIVNTEAIGAIWLFGKADW